MDSLCDLLSQDLSQFLVFLLCSLFLSKIFDSQNFDHCLCSINSFHPPFFQWLFQSILTSVSAVSSAAALAFETGMDFPVLPLQISIFSPAHPALQPGSLSHSFPSAPRPYAPHDSRKANLSSVFK